MQPTTVYCMASAFVSACGVGAASVAEFTLRAIPQAPEQRLRVSVDSRWLIGERGNFDAWKSRKRVQARTQRVVAYFSTPNEEAQEGAVRFHPPPPCACVTCDVEQCRLAGRRHQS